MSVQLRKEIDNIKAAVPLKSSFENQCVYRTYVQDLGKHVSIYSQVDTHGGVDSSVTISSDCILMVSEVDKTLLVLLMPFLEKLAQSCKYP